MAKPLGAKTRIIRAAITANPDTGNTELAEKLNDSADRLDDKLTFTAQDIASQKQAMKKPGALKPDADPAPATQAAPEPTKPAKKKPGRKPAAPLPAITHAAPVQKPISPVDVVEVVFTLADQVGGMDQLKRLVDRLAGR